MNKWIVTVVTAALGVLLLWVGIMGLFGEFKTVLPVGALGLICAIVSLVAGEWLCWKASAGYTHPPAQAGRIAGTIGVIMMGVLLLAAGILSVHAYGIS